jgi:hypothetical protein
MLTSVVGATMSARAIGQRSSILATSRNTSLKIRLRMPVQSTSGPDWAIRKQPCVKPSLRAKPEHQVYLGCYPSSYACNLIRRD